MISNERPSPYGYRPPAPPRPPVQEDTLKYGQVEIEQTSYIFMLKANPRGRFLRITEKRRDGFACLIIPDSGLEAVTQLLGKMLVAANEAPAAANPTAKQTLLTEQVQVERKSFTVVLEQDPLGRFLRIMENAGGRSNVLIIPASGLEAFKNLMEEMAQAANEQPVTAPAGTEAPAAWTPAPEDTLKTGLMQHERSAFTFALKKNVFGRFLRITEEKDGRFKSLVIPAEALDEFKKWVGEMAKASKKLKE